MLAVCTPLPSAYWCPCSWGLLGSISGPSWYGKISLQRLKIDHDCSFCSVSAVIYLVLRARKRSGLTKRQLDPTLAGALSELLVIQTKRDDHDN